MTTASLLRSLRRFWYLPLVGLLLGGFCGLVVHGLLPKKYEASTLLLMSAPGITNLSDSSTYIQNRMPTYAALITSRPVLDGAWRSLPADERASRSQTTVSADVEASTSLIALDAQAPDPAAAADLANAVSRSYVALAPRLDNVSRPVLHVEIVEGAEPPPAPSGPSAPVVVLMGDLLGLTAGVLVTAVRGASAPGRETGSGSGESQLGPESGPESESESVERTGNGLYVP
jgi:succinoglycan biosynthesis transport protein ExoP